MKSCRNGKVSLGLITILCIVLIFSAFLRLTSFRSLVIDETVVLSGYDSFYHLRRASCFSQGEGIPDRDLFTAYPQGGRSHWPPLFDQLLGLVLLIVRTISQDEMFITSLFPVFLGVLNVFLVYFFFKPDEKRIAIGSMIAVAIIPAHVRIGSAGFADHHIMEVLLTTLVLVVLSRSVSRWDFAVSGFLLGLCQLCWRGALLVVLIVGAALIVIQVHNQARGSKAVKIRNSIIVMGTALITYLGGALAGYVDLSKVTFYELSTFQAIPFVLFSALSGIHYLSARSADLRILIISTVTLLFMATTYYFLTSDFYDGLVFLVGKHAWRDTISESLPLFSVPGDTAVSFAVMLFSWFLFLVPIVFILQVKNLYSKPHHVERQVIVLIWLLVFMAMTIRQQRYAHQAAVPFCLLLSLFFSEPSIRKIYRTMTGKVISVVLLIIFCFPLTYYHQGAFTQGYNSMVRIPDSYFRAFQWLKKETPVPGDFSRPAERPDYGIMNPWDTGHWITWLAQRPVVANNFGSEPDGHRQGLTASCSFYLAEDVSQANALLDTHAARFIITRDMIEQIPVYHYILSLPAVNSADYWFSPVAQRLHYFIGSDFSVNSLNGIQTIKGIDGFRLVYSSPEKEMNQFLPAVSEIRIFERVKGARLILPKGIKPPLKLFCPVKIGPDETIMYTRQWTIIPESIHLPYSFKNCPYQCQAAGPAVLTWENNSISFFATEEAVVNGLPVTGLQP